MQTPSAWNSFSPDGISIKASVKYRPELYMNSVSLSKGELPLTWLLVTSIWTLLWVITAYTSREENSWYSDQRQWQWKDYINKFRCKSKLLELHVHEENITKLFIYAGCNIISKAGNLNTMHNSKLRIKRQNKSKHDNRKTGRCSSEGAGRL